MSPAHPSPIPPHEWRERAAHHQEALAPLTAAYRQRKARGELHPVHDFLFSYYRYTAGRLEQWHPALGEVLSVAGDGLPHFAQKHYLQTAHTIALNPANIDAKLAERLRFSRRLLERTAARPGNFSCFGLHEWAMVYRSEQARHRERAPLRLTGSDLAAFVESQQLSCSHFDAVRFFTPAAAPRNRLQPTLLTREDFEQPGCVHANMDLYKWAFKAMPWVGSDLLRATFLLALELRELDMRASPYDLRSYGYEPIPIETSEGRSEYVRIQQKLANKAAPLRVQLIQALDIILSKVTKSVPSPSKITANP